MSDLTSDDAIEELRRSIRNIDRRLGIAESRRDLAGDRTNVLSDRLAGVEHRVGDVQRSVDNLRGDMLARIDQVIDFLADFRAEFLQLRGDD